MPDCFARNCREMAEATIADRPAAAEAAVARYRRAVLPRGVESVEESSGNVGDGQDEVVACRSLRSCPPLNTQQMFLERSSEWISVNGDIGQWLLTMFQRVETCLNGTESMYFLLMVKSK